MCVWREERGLCGLFLLGTLKGLDKQSVRGEDCGKILWKLCSGERWHSTAFWFPKRWEYDAKKKTHGAPWTSIHSAVGDRLFLLSSSKKPTKSVILLKG